MGYPYPVDLFSNHELTRYSLGKTVIDFLRQRDFTLAEAVSIATPHPRAIVEPEYLVDLIVMACLFAAGQRSC